MPAARRILIVDSHPLFRDALAAHLGRLPAAEVTGCVDSVKKGWEVLQAQPPDLLIFEMFPRGECGTTLLELLRQARLPVRTLAVSGVDDPGHAAAAMAAGADGFIGKHEPADVISGCVAQVLAGRTCFPAGVLERAIRVPSARQHGIAQLSDRERQVFELLGDGCSARQIAARLSMSVHTVDTYRERIKRKLLAANGAELNRLAIEWRLRHEPCPSQTVTGYHEPE